MDARRRLFLRSGVQKVAQATVDVAAHQLATRPQNWFRPPFATDEWQFLELCTGDSHIEVLRAIAAGEVNKEIAERLGIAVGTVKQHIHRIYEKLHVQNRTEAVNRYYGR